MTAEEKAKMLKETEWVEKVEELVELGSPHDMYQKLDKMLSDIGVPGYEDEAEESDSASLNGQDT